MTTYNLQIEAEALARDAWEESEGDFDDAMEFLHQSCDGHEWAIYRNHGIKACATNDTSDGEGWLEEVNGGIAQPGDSFGQIACRIAFASLLVAAQEYLSEIERESE
jgi:hypothetical protein